MSQDNIFRGVMKLQKWSVTMKIDPKLNFFLQFSTPVCMFVLINYQSILSVRFVWNCYISDERLTKT